MIQNYRKVIAWVFALLLALPSVAWGQTTEVASGTITSKSGTYVSKTPAAGATTVSTASTSSSSIKWTLDSNGVLTIEPVTYATVKVDGINTQVCPIPNFSTSAVAPWYEYRTKINRVVIKSGITSIGNYSFYRCNKMKSSATEKSISFESPNKVNYVGNNAFDWCEALDVVELPDEIYYIGSACFYRCYNYLKTVKLPANLVSLTSSLFRYCYALDNVVIPNKVTVINDHAFWGCSGLKNVSIPESVTTINSVAFESCTSLESITIPKSVKTISHNPFYGCSKLKNITVDPENKNFIVDGNGFLRNRIEKDVDDGTGNMVRTGVAGSDLYCVPAGKTSSTVVLTIPADVKTIKNYACSPINSKEVVFASDIANENYGVEKIGSYGFYNSKNLEKITYSPYTNDVGDLAFNYCDKLKTVIATDNNTIYASDEDDAVYLLNGKGEKVTLVMRLPGSTKTSYVLPETVKNIRGGAFRKNVNLVEIDLTQGKGTNGGGALTTLSGSYTFSGCSKLKELYLPENITSMSTGELCSGCTNLEKVIFKTTGFTSFGWGTFINCKSLKEFDFPRTVTSTGGSTFQGCTSLKTVNYPSSSVLKTMGENDFNGCTALESITLPKSLEKMNGRDFEGCTKLNYVEIGANVSTFGYQNFYNCPGLRTIKIRRSTPPIIQPDSFDASVIDRVGDDKVQVLVPCKVKSVYEKAQYYSKFFTIDDFYEKPLFDLEVLSNDEELGTVAVTQEQDCNHPTEITAYPEPGVTLQYWSDGTTQEEPENPKILGYLSKSVTWTAFFFRQNYKVYNSVSDEDPFTLSYEDKSYYYNDDVEFTVTPFAGYKVTKAIVKNLTKNTNCSVTAKGENVYAFKMPASDVEISVECEQIKYTITISSTTHGKVKVAQADDAIETALTESLPSKLLKVVCTPDADYEPVSVSVTKSNGEPCLLDDDNRFSMPASDITVDVVFEPIDYRVQVGGTFTVGNFTYTVLSLEPNTVSVAAKDASVAGEQTILDKVTYRKIDYTITAFTNKGFQGTGIKSVVVDRTTPPTLGVNVFDSEIVVKVPCGYAKTYKDAGYVSTAIESITPYEYGITLTSDGNGSVEVVKDPDCDDHSAEIKATANEGYVFSKWSDGNTSNPRTIANVTSNMTLKAIFAASDYTITVVNTAYATLTVKDGSKTVNKAHVNDVLTIESKIADGYVLKAISVKDAANASVDFNKTTNQFTMPASNVTVSAECEAIDYDVIIDATIRGGVIETDKSTANVGQTVTITKAEPSTGYKLKSITVTYYDGTKVTNPVDNKFVMKAGKATVSAIFEQNIYNISLVKEGQCTASVNSTIATYGSIIKVTHSGNDPRYSLASVSVTDRDGKNVTYDYASNQFTMPASDVTIKVTYDQVAEFYVGQTFTIGNFTYTITGLTPSKTVSVAAANASLSGEVEMPTGVEYGGAQFEVTAVTDNGFKACTGIRTVICTSDVPFELGANAFGKVEKLLVPCSKIVAYKGKGYGTYFTNIEENYTGAILSVATANAELGTVRVAQQQDCSNVPIALAEPRKGCMLSKWSDGSVEAEYIMGRLSENTTLTATFVKRNFYVDSEVVTNTASLVTGTISIYETNDTRKTEITASTYNTSVTVDCKPSMGYEVSDISVTYIENGEEKHVAVTNGTFTMPDANVKVSVSFTATDYKINVVDVENGTIKVKTSAIVNELVDVVLIPNTGCEIDQALKVTTVGGINIDVTNGTFFMPASDVTVTATFKKKTYTIGIDENIKNGSVVPSKTSAQMDDEISVTVTPAEGYELGSLSLNDGTVIKDNKFKMPAKSVTIMATFKTKSYKISVAEVEGCEKVIVASSATFGSKVEIGSIIVKEGYKLTGVGTDKVKVEKVDDKYSFIMPASDVVITPTLEKIGYEITINTAIGGTVTATPEAATMGSTVNFGIEALEGWQIKSLTSDEATISIAQDKLTATMTMPAANVTVTPVFEKINYKISVDNKIANGTLEVVGNKTSAQAGDMVKVKYTPKAGYHFTAFLVNGDTYALSADNEFVMPAKDVTLSVTFSATGYGITIDNVEGGNVTAAKTNDVNVGEEVKLTITADEGYEFDKMTTSSGSISVAGDKKSAVLTMAADNATITPSFKKIDYTLSFTANDGNVVEVYVGENKADKATVGDDVTLVFKPLKGYEYKSITADGIEFTMTGSGAKFKMPAKTVAGAVEFSKISYNVKVFDTTHGTVGAPNTATVGDLIELDLQPEKGYAVSKIEVDAVENEEKTPIACAGGKFTMPAANVEVAVVFAAVDYEITYTPTEHGSVSGATTANYAQSVMITVTPDKGYKLNSITASAGSIVIAEDGLSATLTMADAATTVTTTFVAIDYNITYNESANGKISGKATANYQENVLVTVDPVEHYEIEKLNASNGDVKISDDKLSAILTMDAADATLTATFVKKQYPIQIFVTGEGTLTASAKTAGIDEQVEILIEPAPGYKLDGNVNVSGASWEPTSDGHGIITVEAATVVVSANFVESGYAISVEGDEHCTVVAPGSAKYMEEISFRVTPDAGYEITSITVDGYEMPLSEDGTYSYSMPNNDVVISIETKAILYNITIGIIENGTLSSMQETAHVGEEVSVQYQADEGYHFINFYVNDEVKALSDDNKFVMPASDVVLTVKFSESGYGIAVKDVEGGTVVPAVYEANAGDVVDLEIKPAAGYEFVSVGVAEGQKATIGNVDKSALTAKLTMAAENATIVPVFKKASFSISLTANDGNEVEVAKTAVFGDKVTVTFAPAKGYRFKEIKSDDVEFAVDAEGKSATFTMPAKDVKGSVSFEKIAYTIVYAESENGTISGPETACYGDKVTVTVTPDKYHILSDIEVSSGEVEMSDDRQSATITMDADNVIVSATFEKHCDYYQYAPSAVLYDWVLLVDKTEFAKLGYDIDDTNVTWYRIVGEQDDPCDDFDVEDDEVAGQGLYLTSETSLLGSGNYYAVIEVDGERFRTKTFFYESNGQNKVMLVPTRASRRQTLRISGLKDVADVMVYDMTGNLVRVLKTDGNETYNIEAEDNSGMYIVRIVSENKEWSIKYLVK
ncbi:MAG: leucine-rich repeat protein [Bacteroidales bacterium]|nr:leucine-rich repeat protein [Bacteroidales bacterium]